MPGRIYTSYYVTEELSSVKIFPDDCGREKQWSVTSGQLLVERGRRREGGKAGEREDGMGVWGGRVRGLSESLITGITRITRKKTFAIV